MTRRRDITDEQVVALRIERQQGALIKTLAKKYGITSGHVSKIVTGTYYEHLGGPRTRATHQDHCRRGHVYTDETLRIAPRRNGGHIRICVTCRKERRILEREERNRD